MGPTPCYSQSQVVSACHYLACRFIFGGGGGGGGGGKGGVGNTKLGFLQYINRYACIDTLMMFPL